MAVPVTERLPLAVIAALRCPVCAGSLHLADPADRALRCDAGHAFDVARQGHVDLRGPKGARTSGDDVAMVERRQRVLAGGLQDPLFERLDAVAGRVLRAGPPGIVVDVGAGPGHHLARLLDAHPARVGLAVDISKAAAQRAALAHGRAGSIVADIWEGLPVRDRAAALVVDVFAPRHPDEFHRLLGPGGALLVVTPLPHHLATLVDTLGLPEVDPDKDDRLARGIGARFDLVEHSELSWVRTVGRATAIDLAAMGPAGHHLDADALDRRATALPASVEVEAAVAVRLYRPRPAPTGVDDEEEPR
jgi:23S rRNA (guanine745-N1)-methyltransferase